MSELTLKRCRDCGDDYPATREYFGAHNTTRDKLSPYCKPCQNSRVKQTREKQCGKKCPACGEYYPPTKEFFYQNLEKKDCLDTYCRACKAQMKRDRKRRLLAGEVIPVREVPGRRQADDDNRIEIRARNRTADAYQILSGLCSGQRVTVRNGKVYHGQVALLNKRRTVAFFCQVAERLIEISLADLVTGKVSVEVEGDERQPEGSHA